jgi:hypothetical protein
LFEVLGRDHDHDAADGPSDQRPSGGNQRERGLASARRRDGQEVACLAGLELVQRLALPRAQAKATLVVTSGPFSMSVVFGRQGSWI